MTGLIRTILVVALIVLLLVIMAIAGIFDAIF